MRIKAAKKMTSPPRNTHIPSLVLSSCEMGAVFVASLMMRLLFCPVFHSPATDCNEQDNDPNDAYRETRYNANCNQHQSTRQNDGPEAWRRNVYIRVFWHIKYSYQWEFK